MLRYYPFLFGINCIGIIYSMFQINKKDIKDISSFRRDGVLIKSVKYPELVYF